LKSILTLLTAAAKISKPPVHKSIVQRKVQPAVSAPSKVSFVGSANVLQRKNDGNIVVNAVAPSIATVQPSRRQIVQPKVNEAVAVQTKLEIGTPGDRYEQEADAVADRVVSTPDSALAQAKPVLAKSTVINRKRVPYPGMVYPAGISRIATKRVQRETRPAKSANISVTKAVNIEAKLNSTAGRGSPLDAKLKAYMEPRFGADFSQVRIHTGGEAVQMNNALGSQAFAYRNNIYFNRGQYQPDSTEGKRLIAHELTHVVQQGSAIQRKEIPQVSQRPPPGGMVQGLGISDALDYFAERANNIPGFSLLTFIIGVNPINMSAVPRTPANLFRGIIGIMPGGNLIFEALQNHGIIDRVGNWIMQKFGELGMAASMFRIALDQFLDSLSWSDIFDLGGVWNRAKRIFTQPIDRIISFIGGLIREILGFIRQAILLPLARLAEGTRGYDLLKAVLGEDPVTGQAVPRTAATLIGGFMRLIGQEEIWENIQRGNAVARAWAWFQGALAGLMGFVRQIPQLFITAFTSLTVTDLILVPRAFARVALVFGGFIGQFLSWAGNTVWELLDIIFSVVAPGVMPYLRRAAGAFRTIIRNPIGFIGNLVRAGIMGFRQFASRFLTHLRTSLIQWITGALSGANIYIPQALNFMEIIKFVLSVLGLTWQNIRQKLVRAVGETVVATMETGFDIVATLVTQGPAAAWERIREAISNLQQMVMNGIMEFVSTRIVQAAITRLVTSLNPAGAFIQAIIAIYNTVMFFVERLRQIARVAATFIDSISAIASGSLATAANRVEQTMAGMLTLVISFLARLVGLGRVSDAITNIINRIRQPIDRALDRIVDWIVNMARRAGRFLMGAARSAATRVAGWLGLRRRFRTADGENHTLYFDANANPPRLMRASGMPTEILTFLSTLPPTTPNLAQARTLANRIILLTRTPAAGARPTTPQQEERVINDVTALSQLLIDMIPGGGGLANLPAAADWSQRSKSSTAHYSRVYMLSSNSASGGGAASGTSPEFDYVVGDRWVRMHLISYAIGGRGDSSNWVPAPINVNSGGAVRSFEIALERAVRSAAIPPTGGMRPQPGRPVQPNVVWAECEVTGFRPPITNKAGMQLYFPLGVSMRCGIYRPDGSNWARVNAPLSTQNVLIPPPPDNKVRLATSSGTAMAASGFPHLSGAPYSNRLRNAIKDTRGAGFGSYSVLESRLTRETANSRLFQTVSISTIVGDLQAHPDIYLR
jgi:hypothetical protein